MENLIVRRARGSAHTPSPSRKNCLVGQFAPVPKRPASDDMQRLENDFKFSPNSEPAEAAHLDMSGLTRYGEIGSRDV